MRFLIAGQWQATTLKELMISRDAGGKVAQLTTPSAPFHLADRGFIIAVVSWLHGHLASEGDLKKASQTKSCPLP